MQRVYENESMATQSWNWIERAFKKIPLPYPLVSTYLAVFIFTIYMIFAWQISAFELDAYYYLEIAALSLAIPSELAGIQYLLNNIRAELTNIRLSFQSDSCFDEYFSQVKKNLARSSWYYGVIFFVIMPFILNDLFEFSRGNILLFYQIEPTTWSFLLDVYNYSLTYLVHVLLGIILWIILNILLMLNALQKGDYWRQMNIKVFSAGKTGELENLKDLILKATVYYFLVISLVITALISPTSFFRYETTVYVMFLLIGVAFFFNGIASIKGLVALRIKYEVNILEDIYDSIHQRLLKALSEEDSLDNIKDLQNLSTALEILRSDMERYLNIEVKGYNIATLATFITSFIIPVITLLEKIIKFT